MKKTQIFNHTEIFGVSSILPGQDRLSTLFLPEIVFTFSDAVVCDEYFTAVFCTILVRRISHLQKAEWCYEQQ